MKEQLSNEYQRSVVIPSICREKSELTEKRTLFTTSMEEGWRNKLTTVLVNRFGVIFCPYVSFVFSSVAEPEPEEAKLFETWRRSLWRRNYLRPGAGAKLQSVWRMLG